MGKGICIGNGYWEDEEGWNGDGEVGGAYFRWILMVLVDEKAG